MTMFDRAPFIVIWETTRACALACVHCRAQAIPRRHPDELTTEEGRRVIDRVAAFGQPPPLFVLTGGDPLRRPDVIQLVSYGTDRGLTVSLTPSGTAAVTEDRLRALRDAGLARLAVSLDGATATTHDAFRAVVGSHRHTMRILERARTLEIPFRSTPRCARAPWANYQPSPDRSRRSEPSCGRCSSSSPLAEPRPARRSPRTRSKMCSGGRPLSSRGRGSASRRPKRLTSIGCSPSGRA